MDCLSAHFSDPGLQAEMFTQRQLHQLLKVLRVKKEISAAAAAAAVSAAAGAGGVSLAWLQNDSIHHSI